MSVASPAIARIAARPAGFVPDCLSIATRALRAIPREPEYLAPALIVPAFFFAINVGALEKLAEQGSVSDFRAFQLPVAILFSVTGMSRASTLVLDIRNGYFDRLLMTPIRRLALLLGLMIADFVLVVALSTIVLFVGLAWGVGFDTGVPGALMFVLMGGLWGLGLTGFVYAIALKTGNPAAVNSSFILFFPFMLLTTTFLPREALSGWLASAAEYNPVTYLLEGMRSLMLTGWDAEALGKGFAAIGGVSIVSISLGLLALRGRVRPK